MDLYKWCYKLGPLIESELLMDCLELAADARELDMRASPYDLSATTGLRRSRSRPRQGVRNTCVASALSPARGAAAAGAASPL